MLSRGGWPNALDFSLDLELNIPQVYYLMNNSFKECFVHYLMNSNCACVRSTTLDNFALDQTSLDKLQSSRLHSTRWPNALDISLNMHVERCIVKSREPLARALRLSSSKRNQYFRSSKNYTQSMSRRECPEAYSEDSGVTISQRIFGCGDQSANIRVWRSVI